METSEARSTGSSALDSEELQRSLEVFARDLLVLLKTLSVYPDGHPGPLRVAERLTAPPLDEASGEFVLGITPTRFIYDNRLLGSAGSRTEALASLLHRKKLMRLRWGSRMSPDEVLKAALVLGGGSQSGGGLVEALRAAGVRSIAVEPLDITRVHGALSLDPGGVAGPPQGAERGLETWLWLQDESIQPEILARTLCSDDFWALGDRDPSFPVRLIFRHGAKADQALGLLPEAMKTRARECLVRAGRAQPVAELAAVVLAEVKAGRAEGKVLACLLDGLSAEELLDLMARVIAHRDAATSRAVTLFRTLARRFDTDHLLSRIEALEGFPAASMQPAQVWRALKDFLLDLEETRFFGDDYLVDLDRLTEGEAQQAGDREALEFCVDPEVHVDDVFLAVAEEGGGDAVPRLVERIRTRVPALSVHDLLRFTAESHRAIPHLFCDRPQVVQEVFTKVVAEVRALDHEEREVAVELARHHEHALVDLIVSALIRERRIAGRRFLVDLLSALSSATTECLVARTGDAPWYYVRNLATVLGRRRERTAAPVLEALLEYPHDKVRKETLRALGEMGGAATRILARFARDSGRRPDERQLAERILRRKEAEP